MPMTPSRGLRPFLLLFALSGGHASGQSPTPATVPYIDTHTIAGPNVGAPLEYPLTLPAGKYALELSDNGTAQTPPAPLASLKLAVTNSVGAVVQLTPAGASVTQPALLQAGSATFNSDGNPLLIHIAGTPGSGAGSGVTGFVLRDADGDQVTSQYGRLAVPVSSLPNASGAMYGTCQIPNVNNYTVTLTDLGFPQPLSALNMTLTDSATPDSPIVFTAAGQVSRTLKNGTVTLLASGTAGGVNAGLYSVTVYQAIGGPPCYTGVAPVGGVALLGVVHLDPGTYTLSSADLKFPAALAQSGALVAQAGVTVAQVSGAGSQAFTVQTAADFEVYGVALPMTGSSSWPGTGSYAVAIRSADTTVFDVARAVAAPDSGAVAYSYDTAAGDGQSYSLDLSDFAFPAGYTQITAAAAQGVGPAGTPVVVGTPLAGAGTQSLTPAAGPVSLLVFAHPAGPGTGLFGLRFTGNGAAPTFQTTQATGSLFSSRPLSVAQGGNYQLTISDLGFPASFSSLAVVVTNGTTKVASSTQGGNLNFSATAGLYDISVIAKAGGTDNTGTYSMSVTAASQSSSSSSGTGSGGGGAMDVGLLAVLLSLAGLKVAQARLWTKGR